MLIGLSKEEMRESLRTLYRMAEKLGADITSLGERIVDDKSGEKKTVAEVRFTCIIKVYLRFI